MGMKVSEKYKRLNEACNQYPEIVLSNMEEHRGCIGYSRNAKIYVPPVIHAKNGFIERFCL